MSHFTFLVNDEPYCLWDADTSQRTKEFLDAIDPGYFKFMAEQHANSLDSEEKQSRAATATRIAYLHGVETLMTLLGAAIQAPQAPYAWVALARTNLLRGVVNRISLSDRTLHSEISEWDRTWEGLAKRVFSEAPDDGGWKTTTAESFGQVWRLLAAQFLDSTNQLEYNSLKHGFRIRSTGVRVAVGRQTEFGVAAPSGAMRDLGGSDTGSTFYTIEHAGPTVDGSRSRRTRRQSVNWDPATQIRGLQLIDVSISNVVSFMRIANGAPADTVQFHRLEGVTDLASMLRDDIGLRTFSFDSAIHEPILATTKAELLEELSVYFSSLDDANN